MKRNLELPILHNALNAFTAHWPYYSRNRSVTTVLRLQDGQPECRHSITGRCLYSKASTPALRLQPDFYPMRTKCSCSFQTDNAVEAWSLYHLPHSYCHNVAINKVQKHLNVSTTLITRINKDQAAHTRITWIWDATVTNLGRNTYYPMISRRFTQFSQTQCGTVSHIWPQPLPFTSFQIYY